MALSGHMFASVTVRVTELEYHNVVLMARVRVFSGDGCTRAVERARVISDYS